MKKIFLFCLISICVGILDSCNNASKGNNTNSSEDKEEKDSVTLLNEELGVPDTVTVDFLNYEGSKLRFFMSNFIKKNPDCFNNEIAMETYADELKKEIDELIKKDNKFIMDLDVTYDEIITQDATDNETGEKVYIIGCRASCSRDGFYSNDKYEYYVEYDIVGGVSKKEMIKLKEGAGYMIKGTIVSRKDESYNGKRFGLTSKYNKTINLGCFFIKDLKLEEV